MNEPHAGPAEPPKAATRLMTVFKYGLAASIPLLFLYGVGIVTGILCTLGLVFCIFFQRTQASLLECMLVMALSSIPLGLAAKMLQAGFRIGTLEHWVVAVGVAMGPFLFILGGAVWGFSAARRLGEHRTWPRLGLIVLGWELVVGMPLVLAMPIITYIEALEFIVALKSGPIPTAWIGDFLALLAGWLLVFGAWKAWQIEKKCRAFGDCEEI